MNCYRFGILLFSGWALVACDSANKTATVAKEPSALSGELAQGKTIWEANCKVCHGPGLAGAPPAGDDQAWAPRLAKGVDTLIEHATAGYAGPGGHQMPARGGNTDLTDADVAGAVKYMLSLSQ